MRQSDFANVAKGPSGAYWIFPSPVADAATSTGSVVGDARAGWRYIRDRRGLFGLLWMYASVNFTLSFGNVLYIPLVISFASEAAAGGVMSAAGFGAIAGSVAVSIWGGPKRLVLGTIVAISAAGLGIMSAGLRPSLALIAVSAFCLMAAVPVANTASQVLWQTKVPPAVQGRVFAIRRMISQAISPIAILLAGPLADRVFEPAMTEGGRLAGSIGSVLGTGPGRGVGLMYVIGGLATVAIALIGYSLPRIRHLETELPDHAPEIDPGLDPVRREGAIADQPATA